MPYPFDEPKSKHDVMSLDVSSESLVDAIGFSDTSTLFRVLEGQGGPPTDLALLTSIYTYKDMPSPPLARQLSILGVADASVSAVRLLVGDDDDIPSCLHRCTVAVKRADSMCPVKLPKEALQASHAFAGFLRKLQKEGAVAILGLDKYQRFGILKPTEDLCLDRDFEPQDFAATCYVGHLDAVKRYLANGNEDHQHVGRSVNDTTSHNVPDADGLWKPQSDSDPSGDTGFWQPPSAEDSNNGFHFNNSDTQSDTWQLGKSDNFHGAKSGEDDNKFHADAGAAAADRFYSGLTRTLDTRADSRLFHMRAFNGWVKATQIQELNPLLDGQLVKKVGSPLRVLDLACGKGGDLGKWVLHPRGIQNYVGIDVARGSLVDAAIRARKMGQKLTKCTFTCADLGADVPGRLKSAKRKYMQKLSTWSSQNEKTQTMDIPEFKLLRGGGISAEEKFDVVSIQFAIHYMMQTKQRARRFFQTVSELLEIGGNLIATTIDARVVVSHLMNMGLNFHVDDGEDVMEPAVISVGGGACRIRFEPAIVKQIFKAASINNLNLDDNLFGLEYTFTLVEGSDHASGVGDAVNLPEWLIPVPVLQALGQEAGLELDYAQNFHEFFSHRSDPALHAAAHGSMYNMKVLNRNGSVSVEEFEISRLYAAIRFRKVRESTMVLDDEDDSPSGEADESDPVIKAKMFPIALMAAKKASGNDSWASLSSEEKNRLTEIELRKLVPPS